MSFLRSVLFGDAGSYNILGVQAQFEEKEPWYFSPASLEGAGFITKAAISCINSNAFRWITQGYAHVFVHEMGHALPHQLFTHEDTMIKVFKSSCTGMGSPIDNSIPDWQKTIIFVAGPMADVAFCSLKLVAATALKNYLSWPIALALGSGSVVWMSGELLYAYTSVLNKDQGDFGYIARYGDTHLALAGAALISECALGIFAAYKFAA